MEHSLSNTTRISALERRINSLEDEAGELRKQNSAMAYVLDQLLDDHSACEQADHGGWILANVHRMRRIYVRNDLDHSRSFEDIKDEELPIY